MPNISILTKKEIDKFDNPERIDRNVIDHFFNLNLEVRPIEDFNKKETLLGFILTKGYFLATNKFYPPKSYRKEDIAHCCNLIGLSTEHLKSNLNWYKNATWHGHKTDLSNFYGFYSFKEQKQLVVKEVDDMVNRALKPKQIFYHIINFLLEKRIELPTYTAIALVITDAFNNMENKFIDSIDKLLSPEDKLLLDELILLPVKEGPVSRHNPYLISALKTPTQEISATTISKSVDQFRIISDMFKHFEVLFKDISISDALVNYHARWMVLVEHAQFNALKDTNKKYLYLLSFIVFQYRLRQDHFVEILLKITQKFIRRVNNGIRDDFIKQRVTPTKQVQESKDRLLNQVNKQESKLRKVWKVLKSNDYLAEAKIKVALEVIESTPDIKEFITKEFEKLEISVSKNLKEEMFYDKAEANSKWLSRNLKELFLNLNFCKKASDPIIYDPAKYYQDRSGNILNSAPIEFLKDEQRKYVFKDKELNSRLYRCLLLTEAGDHLKAGSLNLRYSNDYRSINDYLISDDEWRENRSSLIERANLENLIDFDKALEMLKKSLDEKFVEINKNLVQNKHLILKSNGKPHVKTDKKELLNNSDIQSLLSKDRFIPLVKILADVVEATEFSDCFTHFGFKGSQKLPDVEIIIAAIIGLGCNIGVRKMGKISPSIGSEKLENVVRWHFSKENVFNAKNRIISLVDELSIPKVLKQAAEEMHTSSDGQKFGVSVPSLHSNYSYKYFGSGRGVTAYSFIDEYSRVFYDTIISPTEREATYVLDGLLDSEVVESTIHSTDTHGYTEILCGVCYSLGIEFAPRIKNVGNQILYTFKSKPRKVYENKGFKILPAKGQYIDTKIMEEQWDNILRLFVSIKLKYVKPSAIFKRLSSYSKTHPLYKALKELGRIHKTKFILEYFDNHELRQKVEKQLNKGELWHKFAKDVWFANNQEFTTGEKTSQEVALGCRNIIQNAIVLWNYLTLTQKLSTMEVDEVENAIDGLSSSQMISWKHVNIHGEYDFELLVDNKSNFSIDKLLSYELKKS
jgi:TnpA family transposase